MHHRLCNRNEYQIRSPRVVYVSMLAATSGASTDFREFSDAHWHYAPTIGPCDSRAIGAFTRALCRLWTRGRARRRGRNSSIQTLPRAPFPTLGRMPTTPVQPAADRWHSRHSRVIPHPDCCVWPGVEFRTDEVIDSPIERWSPPNALGHEIERIPRIRMIGMDSAEASAPGKAPRSPHPVGTLGAAVGAPPPRVPGTIS